MSIRNRSKEERLQQTYSSIIDINSRRANDMKVEYHQLVNLMTWISVFTIKKHLLVDINLDNLNTFSSDCITECLNRLLGDDDSQVMNEMEFSMEFDGVDSMPTICIERIEELWENGENVIASQPPNLLLAMLSAESKRRSNVDYLRTKFQHVLSLPESDFAIKRALQSSDEGLRSPQNAVQFSACAAYFLLLRKYWPVEVSPSNKTLTGFMPNVFRFLKVSLGASIGAMLLGPIVFEIIMTQAEITHTHQDNAIAKRRETEQPRERDIESYSVIKEISPAYQLQTPMRLGPTVIDGYQGRRYVINGKSAFYEEIIFRSLLFRSLLSYTHPAMACFFCTISSTLSCGSFYNEIYSGLDIRHALSLKFVESFLLTLLSYVSLSLLPVLWVRGLLCWNNTVLDEVLNLDDPFLMKELNEVIYWNVPLFLKDPKFYKRIGSQISLELQNLTHAVNTVTVTADSSVKELAGAVMSEYSSPFLCDFETTTRRKLTPEEVEDFIVALEWACSDEVVKAAGQGGGSEPLQPTPLNYVSPLGSPLNYCRGSILLDLFTPRYTSNSQVSKLWTAAMEKLLLGDFPRPSRDDPMMTRRKPGSSFDATDLDPISNNSREYIASQLQIGARRVFNTDSASQDEVEALLLSVLSDPAARAGAPTASPSITSLSHSLFHANNMDSDAFLRLMRDRHVFTTQISDYYDPRIQCMWAGIFNSVYFGTRPPEQDVKKALQDYNNGTSAMRNKADTIFLRSRGLTKRRYLAILNRHSLNPQVKALQSEMDEQVRQKNARNAEEFLEMIKWGH